VKNNTLVREKACMSEGDVTRKKKETYHDYNTFLKLNKVKSQFQIFKDITSPLP
jgi:hypothetical protein